jgi:hypothetical protein
MAAEFVSLNGFRAEEKVLSRVREALESSGLTEDRAMLFGAVTGFIREVKRKRKLKRDRAAARQRLQELWPGGITGFLKEFEADRGGSRIWKFWQFMKRLEPHTSFSGLLLSGTVGEIYDRMTDEERRMIFVEMTRWRYYFESRLREYGEEVKESWPECDFIETV